MIENFDLEKPVYTPREFAALYTRHVRPVSYPTVLEWIEVHRNTGGEQGVAANKTPRGRYLIPVSEVERVLLAAGAKKEE